MTLPELHPSFDASSPPGCCPQSHEILLNKGMEYWDSGLNASSSRTFITRVHIAAAAVIGWKRWGKERTGQTQLSLSFIPRWKPSVLFFCFLFFETHPLFDQTGGFQCRLFLTLWITLMYRVSEYSWSKHEFSSHLEDCLFLSPSHVSSFVWVTTSHNVPQ
jgi:hypothetical protein